MLFSQKLIQQSSKLQTLCRQKNIKLALAESCTGGLLSALLTELSGSSCFFERGIVCYSNQAKNELLQVSLETLENHGAVSTATAIEMAKGCLKNSAANVALSITGIAGPEGGSEDKPVGTVCFAWISSQDIETLQSSRQVFKGNRSEIRLASVNYALEQLITLVEK